MATTTTTHPVPSTIVYAPPSRALVFVRNLRTGDMRYHKATCARLTGLGQSDPTSAVLAVATRAMCCKPAPALLTPYREAAAERDAQQAAAAAVPAPVTVDPDPTPAHGITRPDPTVLAAAEALQAHNTKRTRKAAVLAGVPMDVLRTAVAAAQARTTGARFVAADHPDGYVCRCCGEHLPVHKFPTVSGPEVRGTRCRTCRDAARGAA